MDYKQLQYVLKIYELGSFTKAANELYVSQPSLSNYILKIEEELGGDIFNRSTKPITLTYIGEIYVESARRILQIHEETKERITEILKNKKGRLIVGIPPVRASYMLPLILPKYAKMYPNVKVETLECDSKQLKDALEKGRVDLAVVPFMDDMSDNNIFCYKLLYEEELFLVAQAGKLNKNCYSIKNGERIIQFDRIRHEKFILLRKGHGIRTALDTIFSYYGYKPRIYMETTNNETAFRLATAGLGLAIVPEICLATFRQVKDTEIFKLSEAGLKWKITAMTQKTHFVNIFQAGFISLIKDQFGNKETKKVDSACY